MSHILVNLALYRRYMFSIMLFTFFSVDNKSVNQITLVQKAVSVIQSFRVVHGVFQSLDFEQILFEYL